MKDIVKKNIYRIICIMLIAGVLLGGIGCGLVIAEYSTYDYVGDVYAPGSEYIERQLEYKVNEIPLSKKIKIATDYPELCEIDNSSPLSDRNVIYIQVKYYALEKEVNQPFIFESDKMGAIRLDTSLNSYDVSMLEYKDIFLNNIKNHKIGHYCPGRVAQIKIRVHHEADFSVIVE